MTSDTMETTVTDTEDDTTPPSPPPSSRRWLVPLLALATVVAVAGAVWTGLQVREERAADDAASAALAAGRDAAVAFTSFDHEHVDEDLARVSEMSTGTFRDEFTSALGALTASIKEAEGVSVGEVTDAGLVRSDTDTAVVIAAVDATVTNNAIEAPATRRYRLHITLQRDGEEWLIAEISPVA